MFLFLLKPVAATLAVSSGRNGLRLVAAWKAARCPPGTKRRSRPQHPPIATSLTETNSANDLCRPDDGRG